MKKCALPFRVVFEGAAMNRIPMSHDLTAADMHERNRQAKTLRIAMLFILTLLLMEGGDVENNSRIQQRNGSYKVRGRGGGNNDGQRVAVDNSFDQIVSFAIGNDDNRVKVIQDFNKESKNNNNNNNNNNEYNSDQDEKQEKPTLLHYPMNSTGYYRGTYQRGESDSTEHMRNSDNNRVQCAVVKDAIISSESSSNHTKGVKIHGDQPPAQAYDVIAASQSRSTGSVSVQLNSKHVAGMAATQLVTAVVKLFNVGITKPTLKRSSPGAPSGGRSDDEAVYYLRNLVLYCRGMQTFSNGNITLSCSYMPETSNYLRRNGDKDKNLAGSEPGGDGKNSDYFIVHDVNDDYGKLNGRAAAQSEDAATANRNSQKNSGDDAASSSRAPAPLSFVKSSSSKYYYPLDQFPYPSPSPISPYDTGFLLPFLPCNFVMNLAINASPITPSSMSDQMSILEKLKTSTSVGSSESLVMGLTGELTSSACSVSYNVTTHAVRINWEEATNKAVNYSIWMTVACIWQILVLLRQLHHTQNNAAASRVSILSIGLQAIIDSLSTIFHISLCIFIQTLFTAFLSIVFFKLLIFAVIELKYMSIIASARTPNQTLENSRRQVTLLHARFYASFFASILLFYSLKETFLDLFVMLLFSFWTPQIILNVITETRKPLHTQYIIGMSASRLLLPLYLFGYSNNFVAVAFPGFKPNYGLCLSLVFWVYLQATVLILQSKWGTRFFIPAKFLPPKFDYFRPLPPSLLARVKKGGGSNATNDVQNPIITSTADIELGRVHSRPGHTYAQIAPSSSSSAPLPPPPSSNSDSNSASSPHLTSDDDISPVSDSSNDFSLDCVICYCLIDHTKPGSYMLTPCEHIFHTSCLEQWMEVKMECPTCRGPLPAT